MKPFLKHENYTKKKYPKRWLSTLINGKNLTVVVNTLANIWNRRTNIEYLSLSKQDH